MFNSMIGIEDDRPSALRPKKEQTTWRFFKTYRYIFLIPGLAAFLLLWVGPIYPIFPEPSWTQVVFWKTGLALAISLIYLLWGIHSSKASLILTGNLYFLGAIMFLSVQKCELFVFAIFILPLAIYFINRYVRPIKAEGLNQLFRGMTSDVTQLRDRYIQKAKGIERDFYRYYRHIFLISAAVGYIFLWIDPFHPFFGPEEIGLNPILLSQFWYKTILTLVFSGVILAWGLKERLPGHYSLGSVLYLVTVFYLAIAKLEVFAFAAFLLPLLLYFFWKWDKKEPKWSEIFVDIYINVFLLALVVGYFLLWPEPLHTWFGLHDQLNDGIYWYKSVIMLIFSSAVLLWGLFRQRIPHALVGAALFCISTYYMTINLGEFFILLMFLVPIIRYLFETLELKKFTGDFKRFLGVFRHVFLIPTFIGFVIIWFDPLHPFLDLEGTGIDIAWLKSAVALSISIGFLIWGIKRDLPGHFWLGNLLFLVSDIYLTFVKFEGFVFLIFVIPLLVYALGRKKQYQSMTGIFGPARTGKGGKALETEGHRFYRIYRQVFLIIGFAVFLLLLMMVWIGPSRPLVDYRAVGFAPIWSKCFIILLFGIIFIIWGLVQELRFHVLFGIAMIVIDAWVLAIAKGSKFGAALSIFLTAIAFLFVGAYFGFIAWKQKRKVETPPKQPPGSRQRRTAPPPPPKSKAGKKPLKTQWDHERYLRYQQQFQQLQQIEERAVARGLRRTLPKSPHKPPEERGPRRTLPTSPQPHPEQRGPRRTLPTQTVSEAEKRGPRRTLPAQTVSEVETREGKRVLPTSPQPPPEKREGRRTKPKTKRE
jgi:hypothetical protein